MKNREIEEILDHFSRLMNKNNQSLQEYYHFKQGQNILENWIYAIMKYNVIIRADDVPKPAVPAVCSYIQTSKPPQTTLIMSQGEEDVIRKNRGVNSCPEALRRAFRAVTDEARSITAGLLISMCLNCGIASVALPAGKSGRERRLVVSFGNPDERPAAIKTISSWMYAFRCDRSSSYFLAGSLFEWKGQRDSMEICRGMAGWNIHFEEKKPGYINKSQVRLLEKKILAVIKDYPLFQYILDSPICDLTQRESILEFIRQVVVIEFSGENEDLKCKVGLRPLISYTNQRLNELYSSLGNVSYTRYDLIRFLGKLAGEYQRNKILRADNLDLTEPEQRMLKDILSFIGSYINGTDVMILRKYKNGYTFQHPHLPLIYEAVCQALSDNLKGRSMDVMQLFACADRDSELWKGSEHFFWRFDSLAVFGTAYLNHLDSRLRFELLETLCDFSQNQLVQTDILSFRKKKEMAICLLSYYLCEGLTADMPTNLLIRIYKSSFGHSFLQIQNTTWEYLKQKSAFFEEYAVSCIKQSLKLDPATGYAEGNPYFIYLFWALHENRKDEHQVFLHQTCLYQHATWFGGKPEKYNLDHVLELLQKAVRQLENKENWQKSAGIMPYIYGLNMLLFSFANQRILNHTELQRQLTERLQNPETMQLVIEAAVLCDFFTRLTNRIYHSEKRNTPDMYLLCGAFRFVCCYELPGKCRLSEYQKERYRQWLQSESGRFQCLLIRLLSYTDYFDTEECPKPEYHSDLFLPYDHFPAERDTFLKEPGKLF